MNKLFSYVQLCVRCAGVALAAAACATAVAATPKLTDISEQTAGMRADPLVSVDINRAEIVGRIMAKWRGAYAADLSQGMKEKLAGLRADQLLAASLAGRFDDVLAILSERDKNIAARSISAARSGDTGKAIGDAAKDLVYTPLTPCRLFDTRAGQSSALGQLGGSFTPGAGRNIVPASLCGIPSSDVNSLLISFTTFNNTPNSGGYISMLAPGAPVNTTSGIFNTGSQWDGANTVVPTGPAGQFVVFVAGANAEVVVDVLGYFSRPQATALDCTTVGGTPTNVAAGVYTSLPTLFCPATYTPTGLSISAGENVLVADSYTAGAAGQIFVRSLSVNAQNVTGKLTCCRISGRP
jgi:hypothetical protein